MFSEWASKRASKFILKRVLGKFIKEEHYLDRLQVQLGEGTVQLNDLPLNTDYLNQQLGAAAVSVKEGSIGSLSIKIPWKACLDKCEVELDELELVLVPHSEVNTSGSTKECSTSEVSSKESLQLGAEHLECSKVHEKGVLSYAGVRDGVQMIAKQVERLLLGLRVKIKNLVIAFEQGAETCSTEFGFESSSQSQSILVLRVREIEYGTGMGGDSCENACFHTDDSQGSLMLTRNISFCGATVDLYDVPDKNEQIESLRHIASILTGKAAGSERCDSSVSIIEGNDGGFTGSVQLSIPWKSGCMDIPKVDAEMYLNPIKLRLQLCTIERLIFLLHSFWGHIGTSSKPSIDPQNGQPVGGTVGLGHDGYSSYDCQSESSMNEGMFTSCSESFANMSTSTREEKEKSTLFSDSMFIPNWMQRDELEESINEFFECFDGAKSLQTGPANSSLLGLTYSVFSAITAASTLSNGSFLKNSGEQRVECNLKAKLACFSVILVFEDPNQGQLFNSDGSCTISHISTRPPNDLRGSFLSRNNASFASSMESSRVECLQQEAGCWDTEKALLEANFQDLSFTVQVSAEEARFKAGMRYFEIFGYLFDDIAKATSSGLSNCEECTETNMFSVSCLQSAVEDVLPSFPLSLRIPSMAKKMATTKIKDEKVSCTAVSDISCHKKERICAASKKFVKVHLLTSESDSSESDSEHQLSLICKFANTNCTNSKIRCTSFDVQLKPFILWVDFYIAKRLWHLIEAIENLSSRFNKVSDEEIDGQGSLEKNDSSKGSIMGTVFVSDSRIILCFPKECSKCISPYLLADSFLCIGLRKCRTAENCHSKRLLKQSERFQNDCFSSFSSINLNMGNCDLFLASPTMKKDAGCRHGNAGGLSMCSRKVFSIFSQNENDYSTIGIRWQNVPETVPRIVETAWGMTNRHFARGNESTRVTGNNVEFIRATTAGASEDADSHTREKMIQNSNLFFFFSLPHAQLDLYGADHIVIPNLLHDLTAYIFSEANTRTDLYSEGNHNRESHYHASEGFNSKKSQLSFLIECEVVDIAIHMEELLDIKASMKKELPGLWTDFSLRVQKLATLSVSNLGGMCDASYFWLMHEEGLLHGSLNDRMEKTSESDQKFCLLCCKSNVLGRGDGEGTNALASGNAGTTVIHMSHPQRLQSLTTVMIRCSTLVAPGGRLDWLAAVISFFSQSAPNEHEIAETNVHEGHSECCGPHCVNSFLLELVDVALSYEPFQTLSGARLGVAPYSCTIGNSTEKACAPVACVLAAASVCLSINTKANTVDREYIISFQDVGLLLLDLSKQRNDNQAYDAKSLRAKGYVKIGEEAAMEVVAKINCQDGLLWEVTCKEYHILLKTCYDSTEALMHLVLQLQQLFAPDFEESFVHLQTRPSNSKVNSSDVNGESFGDTSQVERRDDALNAAKEDVDDCHSCEDAQTGLMGDILENAFSSGAEFKTTVENGAVLGSRCKSEPHFLLNGLLLQEECALDGTASTSVMNVDSKVKDETPSKPKTGIQVGVMHVSCQENNFSFIEDYYYPESFSMSQRSESKQSRIGESSSPKKTMNTTAGDVVDVRGGWYEDTIVRVLENHISEVSQQNSDRLQGKEDDICSGLEKSSVSCKSVSRILLKNFSIEWRMIAGSDWPIVNNCDSFPMNGENARNESSCLKVELCGVDFQYDTFPSGGIYASKLAISIHDLLILDDSKNAPWKKVLFDSRLHPRESSAKALKLKLEAVKPDPSTPLEEYRLLVKLHPLRIHLDQSQLEFFINFFSQIDSAGAPQADPTSHMLCSKSSAVDANNSRKLSPTEDTLLPFFQKCVISPFTIHVDYVPRRVNFGALQGGNYAELLNLISWKGIDLHLKHIETAGVYGWTHLLEIVIDEWQEDITQNQVHKLIRGAAPIRPLFAVGSGAVKLISIPAEHYRKDQHLLKGVQKGVIAFLRSISLEALSCGVQLASGAHGILIHTESALGSIPPSFSRPSGECSETVGKCNQPGDACQGLLQACESLTRGFERTAASLISNPIKSYNRGDGAGTAIATAFRATPAAVIAPVSAAAGAVHRVLLGVRNSLDPERRKESEEKYSGPLPALILAD